MITGVGIRRVGGEDDILAKVELTVEVDGKPYVIGQELINSNFSSWWNLKDEEFVTNPKKFQVKEPE